MAQIPTISEIYTELKQNVESELGDSISTFGKVFLNAWLGAYAFKMKLYYLVIAEVQKNIFVDTCDVATLKRFGLIKLGRLPFQATQGVYTVNVNGDISAVIEAGTVFKSNDDSANPGKLFILDTEKTIVSQPDTMVLRALEGGTESRLEVGDELTSTKPLLNVTDLVDVDSEDEIPLAAEDIEDYRTLVINAFRQESQGGAATDYRLWAADAQGVRFVYPYVTSGECAEIDLYVEANKADSDPVGSGIPTAQILSDVSDVIEFDPDTTKLLSERGRRPLGVHEINIYAVTPKDVIITFTNATFSTATETAVEAALEALIDDIRPFIDAADIEANRNDKLSINKVISTTQELLSGDEGFDSVAMTVDAVPVTTSITFEDGDIPILDTVNF